MSFYGFFGFFIFGSGPWMWDFPASAPVLAPPQIQKPVLRFDRPIQLVENRCAKGLYYAVWGEDIGLLCLPPPVK